MFEGAILPDGSVNYKCGCVSSTLGLLTGPCGPEFRELHTCLVTSDTKGGDCGEKYLAFRDCYTESYPILPDDDDDEEEEVDDETSKQGKETSNTDSKLNQ